ncbi:MAG: hypothetical protein KDE27_31890 [Planctomycetes bacterium]|nr:hypothetical protein [Planctomycetota bacterium]
MTPAADASAGPREILDPLTGRPILLAPVRQHRPMHTTDRTGSRPCPFCPGNEHETPPERDAARPQGAGATAWIARAFANKYPASLHHEVIAEGSAHREQPADLDVATWRAVLGLWQRRVRALEAEADVACTFLFKNVGAAAGASIAHNHSQLLGLAAAPPRVRLELEHAARLADCPWCESLRTAAPEGRLVFESERHAVLCPHPPKLPHETWLLPRDCGDDFLATDLDSLAAALHALFRAVDVGLGRPAFNFWLHRLPTAPAGGGRALHWHFELQPRTGQVAGLELGGDMYINSFPADVSAERLRAGLDA